MNEKYDLKELEKDAAVICRDFTIFCNFITENKVKLAKKTGHIGKKDCFALNTLLYVKEEYERPTYFQGRYAIISFFYYIAVRYKILEMNPAGTELHQGQNYQIFFNASIWEQYILFWTVFICDGIYVEEDNLGYRFGAADMWMAYVDSFMEWFVMEKPDIGSKHRISRDSRMLFFFYLDLLIPYLKELNLVKVWEKPEYKRLDKEFFWEIEALPLLEMISDLYENIDIDEEQAADLPETIRYIYMDCIEKMIPSRKPGSLLKLFERTSTQELDSVIDLEVSVRHTDCIRVIRMNMRDSLVDLHRMIQEAVEFGNDHFFEFSIGSRMMKRTYVLSQCRRTEREFLVEDTALCDLELTKGQKFTYLFDYGDMWWFDIRVLQIQKGVIESPAIIKAVNDAPEQYPFSDDL